MKEAAERLSRSVNRTRVASREIGTIRPTLSPRNLLLCALLVFSSSSMLGGSRSDAFGCIGLPTRKVPLMAAGTKKTFVTIASKNTLLFSSPQDEDEDDDGWGSPALVDDNEQQSDFERDRKVNELRYLREEASNKATSPSSSRDVSEPPERDMFIPIMAVVSLLGLFGAYGYETLRLASRGELYLPF